MNPFGSARGLPCPVCGRPVGDVGTGPCPSCGLPAAAHAAVVMARIGATLTELQRDRDELLASLRAAAPWTASMPAGVPAAPARPSPSPGLPPRPALQPSFPPPPSARPPSPAWLPPPSAPRRRISPQQVLLGLGALLLVAAAITFVAVAWSRFGLVFQAGVMVTVTTLTCTASAWAARRGLRATEEALAAAGAALLVVDLGAARALGLFRVEDMALRTWWTVSCAVVVVACLALGRLTRTTVAWPLVALLAAQPLPFLVLPSHLVLGPAGAAAALALAAADALTASAIRAPLPVARLLAGLSTALGVLIGLTTASLAPAGESWTATAVLAGAGALLLDQRPGAGSRRRHGLVVPVAVGAVVGWALAGSLEETGDPGLVVAALLGWALITGGVLLAGRRVPVAVLVAAGAALVAVAAAVLGAQERYADLALVALAVVVPAGTAAVRLPALRLPATASAVAGPYAAVLLARADGVLAAELAGLLLALLATTAFALATLRARRPEEWLLAAAGGVAGLTAGAVTSSAGAWGQVGLQLTLAGVAAGGYALVTRRRAVGVGAVADLVVACWIAVGGTGVETPEAYTLPAAAGLLVVALPRLRDRAPSWAAEGAAAGVALVPSALVVVAEPTALRLVLVVATGALLAVAGTLLHRQAPFVIGTAVLLVVAVGRLSPYAPLLPRWVTLGTAGLLLLVVGATYERRRQQAREAIGWVAQMH